jgi:hypothetical protein
MKQTVLALMFALAVVPLVSAHEGHDHKIMGTVSAIQANHLEVKGTDGKTSTFTLTDATKVIRGKVAMTTADLKNGDRVVVTAAGAAKGPLVAKEVRLGGAPAAKPTTTTKK